MSMDKQPTAAKIKAALSISEHDLTEEQASALEDFVQCLSIERAREAIESLAKAKKAGGIRNARHANKSQQSKKAA